MAKRMFDNEFKLVGLILLPFILLLRLILMASKKR